MTKLLLSALRLGRWLIDARRNGIGELSWCITKQISLFKQEHNRPQQTKIVEPEAENVKFRVD